MTIKEIIHWDSANSVLRVQYATQKDNVSFTYEIPMTIHHNSVSEYRYKSTKYHSFILDARKKITMMLYGEEALKAWGELNEHYVTWYPYPDRDMERGRGVCAETMTRGKRLKTYRVSNRATNIDPRLSGKHYDNPFKPTGGTHHGTSDSISKSTCEKNWGDKDTSEPCLPF